MWTSAIVVGVEEVAEAVDTVVKAVGDVVVILSVGVIEHGELWLAKILVKVDQLWSGKLFQPYSVVKTCFFWCNV